MIRIEESVTERGRTVIPATISRRAPQQPGRWVAFRRGCVITSDWNPVCVGWALAGLLEIVASDPNQHASRMTVVLAVVGLIVVLLGLVQLVLGIVIAVVIHRHRAEITRSLRYYLYGLAMALFGVISLVLGGWLVWLES